MVARDVRERADRREMEMLRSPEFVGEWILALKEIKRDIEQQHKRRKAQVTRSRASMLEGTISRADLARIEAESREWREGAGRVLKGVETRLDEAKSLAAYFETHGVSKATLEATS